MDPILDQDFDQTNPRYKAQEERILRGYGLRPRDIPLPANARHQPQQVAA